MPSRGRFPACRGIVPNPAVAALVGRKPIEDGMVGGLLKVEVEGGFDLEAGLMNLLGPEAFFQLLAHLLLEPGATDISGWAVWRPRGRCARFGLAWEMRGPPPSR